jgi:hypothetical protein
VDDDQDRAVTAYPPAPRTVEEAIAWLSDPARGDGWKGWCLKAARSSYGLPGGVSEADVAADQAQAAGLLNPDRHPPRGAAVFWYIGEHGHVGIADGAGRFHGTDLPTTDYIGLAPLTDPETRWGATWRGWSPLLNGHLIDLNPLPGPPEPKDDDMAYTATDPGNQTWLVSGVWKRKITWDQANKLAALADPVPYNGSIDKQTLDAYEEAK